MHCLLYQEQDWCQIWGWWPGPILSWCKKNFFRKNYWHCLGEAIEWLQTESIGKMFIFVWVILLLLKINADVFFFMIGIPRRSRVGWLSIFLWNLCWWKKPSGKYCVAGQQGLAKTWIPPKQFQSKQPIQSCGQRVANVRKGCKATTEWCVV